MSRNVERIIGIVLVVLFFVFGFFTSRGGANTTIDNAQATADALSDFLTELAVVSTEASPAATSTPPELADTPVPATLVSTAKPTKRPTKAPTDTPEPTNTPEFCYPTDLDEAVVIRDPRLNLWEVIGENKAGKFIMDIYEDDDGNRVQYALGAVFFIYEDGIVVDGGDVFYVVFGPRGGGLYVKGDHIKLFDDTPDNLIYCE